MVVNVVGNRVLLEYANGTITTIDVSKWSLLKPETATCQGYSERQGKIVDQRTGQPRTGVGAPCIAAGIQDVLFLDVVGLV